MCRTESKMTGSHTDTHTYTDTHTHTHTEQEADTEGKANLSKQSQRDPRQTLALWCDRSSVVSPN